MSTGTFEYGYRDFPASVQKNLSMGTRTFEYGYRVFPASVPRLLTTEEYGDSKFLKHQP